MSLVAPPSANYLTHQSPLWDVVHVSAPCHAMKRARYNRASQPICDVGQLYYAPPKYLNQQHTRERAH